MMPSLPSSTNSIPSSIRSEPSPIRSLPASPIKSDPSSIKSLPASPIKSDPSSIKSLPASPIKSEPSSIKSLPVSPTKSVASPIKSVLSSMPSTTPLTASFAALFVSARDFSSFASPVFSTSPSDTNSFISASCASKIETRSFKAWFSCELEANEDSSSLTCCFKTIASPLPVSLSESEIKFSVSLLSPI